MQAAARPLCSEIPLMGPQVKRLARHTSFGPTANAERKNNFGPNAVTVHRIQI
jgi:hypothetical protein